MLERLLIKNIGLIESAELQLGAGFTVLTGETGAGKSMLMDALDAVLGARIDTGFKRAGAEDAMVEATFMADAREFLAEHGLTADDDVTLRRMVGADGKSKLFINSQRVTAAQVQELGAVLAEIHGQNDRQVLMNPRHHAELLDRFGGCMVEREHVATMWKSWRAATAELAELQEKIANKAREVQLLRAYVEELDSLTYQAGEEAELAETRTQLMASEHVIAALTQANAALEDGGCVSTLAQASRALNSVAGKAGASMAALAARVESCYVEVEDMAREVAAMADHTQPDPARLQQVDERLNTIRDLCRKHRVGAEELPALLQKFTQELTVLDDAEGALAKLAAAEKAAQTAYMAAGKLLGEKRRTASPQLDKAIMLALKELLMPHTRFSTEFTDLTAENATAQGLETVRFMVAVNPGSPLLPLEKSASGGEVSRLMLALKTVFFAKLPPMTLVFDEIDTGIGGAVAEAAGRAMRTLAQTHQVLAITHHPQVAAQGQQHVKIEKKTDGKTTRTNVRSLTQPERTEELARMLSGAEVTATTRAAAEEMLARAA
ncbi:MAG: DNA repair protein RecN [Alphaproteobacteria bacterium]